AGDSERRWLGLDAPGVAGVVPLGGAAALLPAWLAQHPQPGQAEGGVPGVVGPGMGGLPRPGPAVLQPAAAAAVGVGAGTVAVGVAAGAGPEAVRSFAGVRPGLRSPRRSPNEQHAGPGDALYESVLRGLSAPARQRRGGWVACAGLGVVAQRPPLGARSSV